MLLVEVGIEKMDSCSLRQNWGSFQGAGRQKHLPRVSQLRLIRPQCSLCWSVSQTNSLWDCLSLQEPGNNSAERGSPSKRYQTSLLLIWVNSSVSNQKKKKFDGLVCVHLILQTNWPMIFLNDREKLVTIWNTFLSISQNAYIGILSLILKRVGN